MEIVEVIWVDAGSIPRYVSEESSLNMTAVERCNVGYLIKEDEENIVIIYGQINLPPIKNEEPKIIPKVMIKKLYRLHRKE